METQTWFKIPKIPSVCDEQRHYIIDRVNYYPNSSQIRLKLIKLMWDIARQKSEIDQNEKDKLVPLTLTNLEVQLKNTLPTIAYQPNKECIFLKIQCEIIL